MTWEASVEVLIDGQAVADLPVVTGQVTEDATGVHRQVGSVTFLQDRVPGWVRDELLSADPQALLRPVVNGVELCVARARPDDLPFAPVASWTVGLVDLSAVVAANLWTAPHTVDGATTDVAVRSIIEDRLPGLPLSWNLEPSTYTVSRQFGQSVSDPWADVAEIAAAAGMECFFDGFTVVLRTIPDPDAAGDAWSFHVGNLIAGSRRVDTLTAPNQVVVRGELVSGAPVRSTYPAVVAGTPRPHVVESVLVTSQAQADDIAEKAWRKVGGVREVVSFTALHPSMLLRAGQVGTVVEASSGTVGRWVLDQVVRPIGVDVRQTAVTRERSALVAA